MEDKKQKTKSSYAVFMSHYKRAGAAGMVSLECFREWAETRKEPAKKPEESFRRSVTAHICKSSGRRPFDPEVEADLLNFIRRKEPWPMAKALGLNIGGNGFRAKGYHESQQKQKKPERESPKPSKANQQPMMPHDEVTECEECESLSSESERETKSVDSASTFSSCPEEDNTTKGSADYPIEFWIHSESEDGETTGCLYSDEEVGRFVFDATVSDEPVVAEEGEWMGVLRDILEPPSTPERLEKKTNKSRKRGRDKLSSRYVDSWMANRKELRKLCAMTGLNEMDVLEGTTAQGKYVLSLLQSFTPTQFSQFRRFSGFDPISPSSLYLVEGSLENRFRMETLNRGFLCPAEQDKMRFLPLPYARTPVGRFRYDTLSAGYVETDHIFQGMVGGQIAGKRTLDVQPSELHMSLTMHWAGPLLRQNGFVWTQMRFRNLQTGFYNVLRVLWTPSESSPHILDVAVQDVTNEFPHLVVDEQLPLL